MNIESLTSLLVQRGYPRLEVKENKKPNGEVSYSFPIAKKPGLWKVKEWPDQQITTITIQLPPTEEGALDDWIHFMANKAGEIIGACFSKQWGGGEFGCFPRGEEQAIPNNGEELDALISKFRAEHLTPWEACK